MDNLIGWLHFIFINTFMLGFKMGVELFSSSFHSQPPPAAFALSIIPSLAISFMSLKYLLLLVGKFLKITNLGQMGCNHIKIFKPKSNLSLR